MIKAHGESNKLIQIERETYLQDNIKVNLLLTSTSNFINFEQLANSSGKLDMLLFEAWGEFSTDHCHCRKLKCNLAVYLSDHNNL